MLKKITKLVMFSTFGLILMSFVSQVVSAVATCEVNGREVPCDQLGETVKGFFGWGIGIFLIFFAFGIWAMVFWIMMIVHAVKHDIENKAMWIIIMVFTGFVGAIVYYFVIKKEFDKKLLTPVGSAIPTSPTSSVPPETTQ